MIPRINRYSPGTFIYFFRLITRFTEPSYPFSPTGGEGWDEGERSTNFDFTQKSGVFFHPSVKKTYLTLMYLTVVSTNKIRGFVQNIFPFREAVQKTLTMLISEEMLNSKC